MAAKTVIELDNLYLKSDRGEQIFSDLNFRLEANHSAVITGAAGSGKTCLVELLVGLRRAESGSVELFGENVKPRSHRLMKKLRGKVGGVGGIYTLVPSYTVAQNVVYPLIVSGERRRLRFERLHKMLTEFSLVKQAGEYPQSLTRVEYTMAQFARASINNQPLLIVDEPSAGLDPATFDRIYDYLVKTSVSGRSMLILTSSDLGRELPNTDYYQIEDGRLT